MVAMENTWRFLHLLCHDVWCEGVQDTQYVSLTTVSEEVRWLWEAWVLTEGGKWIVSHSSRPTVLLGHIL